MTEKKTYKISIYETLAGPGVVGPTEWRWMVRCPEDKGWSGPCGAALTEGEAKRDAEAAIDLLRARQRRMDTLSKGYTYEY